MCAVFIPSSSYMLDLKVEVHINSNFSGNDKNSKCITFTMCYDVLGSDTDIYVYVYVNRFIYSIIFQKHRKQSLREV